MKNIAIRLTYDGSRYHGWQTQKSEITVQQTLEQAIEKMCGEKVHVTGCGRTDAGVHALRYCANFKSDCRIPMEKLPLALNSYLPADIAVLAACEAEESFNAIGSCIKKEYIYKIHNSNLRDPFLEKRACFYPQRLDVEKMNAAATELYRDHGIDLYKDRLQIAVCAQHCNGGVDVDLNWQTSVKGLYCAGEAAGTFGVYRPGGSALNSTQVGSLRAAEHIARTKKRDRSLLYTQIFCLSKM